MNRHSKKVNRIIFVIHPTKHGDYDLLAIGNKMILEKLAEDSEYYHLINSHTLAISLIVLDTCNSLSDANNCIKEYQKMYDSLIKTK